MSQDKYVFLHIGKTAGSAVRDAITGQFKASQVCPYAFYWQIQELPAAERERFRLFCAHVGYQQAAELGNRIFTLLRDPVDRVLSLYYYWQQSEGDEGGPELARNLGMEEFLESREGAVVTDVYDTQTWQLAFAHDGFTRRELKQTLSEDQVYQQALSNLEKLDVVGVQEKLGAFTQELEQVYGWRLPKLLRSNVTSDRPKRDDLPISVRKLIQQKVPMDTELYAHALRTYINC